MNPEEYFSPTFFTDYFNTKLRSKKGGALDGLTPDTFWKRYERELEVISKRCIEGTYKFSPYLEKLILKGKDKFPRILSVPSMRDRMVLGALNKYLQDTFPEAVNHEVPNQYIKEVSDFLAEHSKDKLYFLKTDIKGFYDNIDLNTLYEKLESRVDEHILRFIMSAIDTITIPRDASRHSSPQEPRLKGVPQGLAISNILASISMLDFDAVVKEKYRYCIYKRYVDDILILSTTTLNAFSVDEIQCEFILKNLGLCLSPNKTMYGEVGNISFDYIGYMIESALSISIRKKNIQVFLNRISRLISRYRSQKSNPFLRPRFIAEDKELDDYYIALINQKLAGIKVTNHLFGWIAYFQAMTDIHQLYELDTVIHKKFLRGCEIEPKICHLQDVYWDIKKHAGKNKLLDLDAIKNIGVMKAFLLSRGLIDKDFKYDDDEIQKRYYIHLEHLKKDAWKSIGITY